MSHIPFRVSYFDEQTRSCHTVGLLMSYSERLLKSRIRWVTHLAPSSAGLSSAVGLDWLKTVVWLQADLWSTGHRQLGYLI